jgi:flagellar hook protein FlgE
MTGAFSNGQTENLARVMLADFANYGGLSKVGTYFTETDESGEALINQPGTGSLGGIQASSLEVSNTDVAAEFINMITAQRAYQACAKVITTASDLLTVLMNVKQ